MATESRPRSFKQVLAESLAKGLAEYQVKRQEKLDDEASAGRQQMVMDQQAKERQMKMAEHKARMTEIDMQIRRHTIEMAMTPQQREAVQHQYRMEEQAALQKQKQEFETSQFNQARELGYVPSGWKNPADEEAKQISAEERAWRTYLKAKDLDAQSQNVDIAQGNVGIRQSNVKGQLTEQEKRAEYNQGDAWYKFGRESYDEAGFPSFVPQDTVPHVPRVDVNQPYPGRSTSPTTQQAPDWVKDPNSYWLLRQRGWSDEEIKAGRRK